MNGNKVDQFVEQMNEEAAKLKDGKFVWDKWQDFHLSNIGKYSLEQLTAYCFVVDAINFCFWPSSPNGEFEYEHMTRNLEKILDEDPLFFTAQRLATVTEEAVRDTIFGGIADFSLLDERARLLRQLGQRLLTTYPEEPTFTNLVIKQGPLSAPMLVKRIIDTFEGFRDQAVFEGRQVFFYKRAQILVADLIGAYQDFREAKEAIGEDTSEIKEISDTEQLTMFADYRVPQILRHIDILKYSPELEAKIDSHTELPFSCKEEVALRAATVMAVDAIQKRIQQVGSAQLKQQIRCAYHVDWLLWQMGEKRLAQMKPHHKVTSTFY